ncbi:hypothetical protein NKG94_21300 [Micromonospora sp. M12]
MYGSGKSTLAARLADQLGLPWCPVDDLLWLPGWVEVPVAQQRSRIEEICRRDRWIIDGRTTGGGTSRWPAPTWWSGWTIHGGAPSGACSGAPPAGW